MSIELCILASGSSGNCTLVRTPAGTMLLDAGIGPRTASRRMNGTGVVTLDLSAICLTHLDRDHFSIHWTHTIRKHAIPVFCHRDSVDELLEVAGAELEEHVRAFHESFEPLPGLRMQPVAVAHDEKPCHSFVIEGFGCRVGYATDLGHIPATLVEQFRDLDILALESNYDPRMQLDSPRPPFLKRRIMGGRGHLSNQQAFAAVRRILDEHETAGSPLPAHVVLLHRSRQCNCPRLLRRLFLSDVRLTHRLTLAEQFQPSSWLRPRKSAPLTGEQLTLAWA